MKETFNDSGRDNGLDSGCLRVCVCHCWKIGRAPERVPAGQTTRWQRPHNEKSYTYTKEEHVVHICPGFTSGYVKSASQSFNVVKIYE